MAATEMISADRRRADGFLWLMTAAMAVGAVLLFPSIPHAALRFGPRFSVAWPLIAVGFAVAEMHALHLRFRGNAHTVTLNEILVVVALFGLPPTTMLAAQLLGATVALAAFCRQPMRKLAFNIAQFALGTSCGVVLFRALADGRDPLSVRSWLAALLACVATGTTSIIAIGLAIRVTDGRFSASVLLRSFGYGLIGTVVNTMLGLVVVIECTQSRAAAILLVAPVLVVFLAYRAYLSERSKSEGLQFLYTASEVLNSERDLDNGLLALLQFAREAFHADMAEILLMGEPGEVVGYRTVSGPGGFAARLQPVAVQTVESVVELATAKGAALVKPDTGSFLEVRDGLRIECAMVAAVEDEAGVRGALLLARGRGTVDPFGKEELRLFETFANHVGMTLEKERLTSSLERLRKAEQELAYQAYHDSLTGLANRALFRDRVDAALAESDGNGSDTAVLFIDLDDFKTVNDTKGHAAGDALLIEIGERLSRSVGGRDTAARLGGDEFAVLLRNVGHDSQVNLIANSILGALREPIDIEGQDVVMHASIGIALRPAGADIDAAALMQHADVAMYTAKRNGKGRFDQYEPNMSLSVARRHQLKVGLERAVGAHEFLLEYQPVVDTASGAIVGAEALLRWRDPVRGLMYPGEFVAVAEETGLIVPIGRMVLREACRRGAEWVREDPNLRMFVNLSARQLAHPDIVHDVASALASAGLHASRLVLEVTETAMMRDVDEAAETLHALKALGVDIAIDDFGTGFSSLSYLRQLPIDVLKIAKPIVDAICESQQDAAFVKGIIELGHVVGVKVVAEGVEQVEQYAHLVDMGCDFVQGFYYSPSMEPERFVVRLRAERETIELEHHLAV